MRTLACLALGLSLSGTTMSSAQSLYNPFVKDYKLDFAIPDAPAFKLLEVDQSVILRPQTVKELTLAVDGFRGTNNAFVVPKQFGVEFSPGLIIGSDRLRVADYQTQTWLYSTRLSGSTKRDSLNRVQAAGGVRFTLRDEADLRAKGAGGNDTVVTRFTMAINDVYVGARERIGPPPAPIVLNAAEQAKVKALQDSVSEYWTKQYWNARSIEFAAGARANTTDSLGHDPELGEAAGWLTYADGIGRWGQFLFGIKFGASRDIAGDFKASNTVATRLYLGSNEVKAFFEAQQSMKSQSDAEWLVSSGLEFQLKRIGWVNASAGFASDPVGGKVRGISSFRFKTSLPGM